MTLRLAWQVLFWAWLASEILIVALTYTRRGKGSRQDRGSMMVLWVVNCSAITVGLWYAATRPATMFHGATWVRSLALAILVLGLAIRWTAMLQLGRAFSVNVAIREGQRVMHSGLYRWMRHPSYTGLLLAYLALGVRSLNWVSVGIIMVPVMAALLYRIRVEEAVLTQAFGEQYRAYCAATPRLIPGVY
jgi:protein-S-isoprenylcysteine O-methyltransferase Ste14